MIHRFLCWLGLHDWAVADEEPGFDPMDTILTEVCRDCPAKRTRVVSDWDQMSGL